MTHDEPLGALPTSGAVVARVREGEVLYAAYSTMWGKGALAWQVTEDLGFRALGIGEDLVI